MFDVGSYRAGRARRRLLGTALSSAAAASLLVALPGSAWAKTKVAEAGAPVITTVAGAYTTQTTGPVQNGAPSTSQVLGSPLGVAIDSRGNVIFADQNNNVIRVAATATGTFYGTPMTAGHVYTVAGNGQADDTGDGGPPLDAALDDPNGVAVDSAGDLAITDTGNNVVRFVPTSTGSYFGQTLDAGQIFTIAAGSGSTITQGGQATDDDVNSPDGVTFDSHGNLVICDTGNNVVRFMPDSDGTYFGIAMQPGRIYTIAGDGNYGYTGDGGPALSAELQMDSFDGVAVDPHGNVVFADVDNNVVRVVADSTGTFYGKSMTVGHIYTIAGNGKAAYSGDDGPATSAALDSPQGIAVDAAGDVFIADSNNNVVRMVAAATGTYGDTSVVAGDIYTVAGDGKAAYGGDGGPATAAKLDAPGGVAVGSQGQIVVADNGNNVIREVTAATPAVTSVHPLSAPVTGGKRVTLKGTDLWGVTEVLFGGRPATSVTVTSKGKVVAVAPAAAQPGSVSVQVVTLSASSPALADAFTYVASKGGRRHGAAAGLGAAGARRADLGLG